MAEGFKIGSAYIEILLEEQRARQDAARLGRDMGSALPNRTVKIDADIARAEAQLNKVNARLEELRNTPHGAKVDLDIAEAEAKARQIQARIQELRDKRVRVDADTGGADAGIRRVSSGLSGLRDRNVRVVVNTAGSIAALAALTSAAGVAAAALSALPGIAASVGGGIGVLAGSFSGVGDALKGYAADQDAASAAGSRGASAARSNAAQIRDAQQAVDDARRNAARVARASSQAVQDAVRDEARAAEEAAEAIADAREDQARTAERGAQQMEDAAERVADAMDRERDAQEDLTRAREDAARALEDLQERVSDYALDEEGAQLRIERARQRLAETNADAGASDLDKREAAHDLAVAEERLSDIQRERAEDTANLADAEAKGIDGSDQVVAAQERVADAHDDVLDAQKEQARTAQEVARANSDAAERVAEAIEDGEQRQADAARATARARQAAADAQADAARQVRDAEEALADAQAAANEAVGGGAAGAVSKYQQALAKLNPYQRELVEQLLAMQPLVDRLKFAASETFLPGFIQMLKDSEGLFPIFEGHIRRTGDIMGETALKFGDLFKSDQFKQNLDAMFRNSDPITRAIGDSFVRLTGKIVEFGAEMDQSALGFAGFIDGVTLGLEGFFDKVAEHDESFKRVWDALGRIAEVILPAVGEAIGRIADAVAPVLEQVADFLEQHKDSIDEVILALLGLFATLKAAKLVSAVAGWSKSVIGFIDDIGRKSKDNKTHVDDLLDSLDPDSKKNKGRKFGQFGALGAGFLGGFLALGGGYQTVDPGEPGYEEHQQEYRPRIESHGMNPDDPQFQMSAWDRWMADFPAKLETLKTTISNWWNEFWSPEGSLNSPLYAWGQSVTAWWDGLWGENGTVMTTIRGWGGSILGFWDGLWGPEGTITAPLYSFRDTVTAWWDGLWGPDGTIMTTLNGWRESAVGWLLGLFGSDGTIMTTVLGWGESILGWWNGLWGSDGTIMTTLNGWKESALGWLQGVWADFQTWLGETLPNDIATWFETTKTNALNKLDEWKTNAGTWLEGLWSDFKRWLGETLPRDVQQWFEDTKAKAVAKLTEWKDEAIRKAGEVGSGILDGIRNGINNGWTTLTNFVRQKALDLLTAAKNALGINSPSKVFSDVVGRAIPEGIGVGIIKHAKLATDQVRGLAGDVVDAGALPPGLAGSASLGRSQSALSARQTFALDRLVSLMEQESAARQRRPGGDVHVHLEQTSGSPAETGRFVSLALRTVG